MLKKKKKKTSSVDLPDIQDVKQHKPSFHVRPKLVMDYEVRYGFRMLFSRLKSITHTLRHDAGMEVPNKQPEPGYIIWLK